MFWLSILCSAVAAASLPVSLGIKRAIDSGLANVHLKFSERIYSDIAVSYGSCQAKTPGEAHHLVATARDCHDRLLWRVPADAPASGCLSAWDHNQRLVGRSNSLSITPSLKTARRRLKRRQDDLSISMDNSSGIDSEGPWFDGVALLKGKDIGAVNVEAAKATEIAIVGAGMGGLMTWLALEEAGMSNLTIIEASQRLGGRVHTAYLGDPSERQYQVSIEYAGSNETVQIQDHRLVFQLADEMNIRNNHSANFSVSFIPWLQRSPNGLSYFNGLRKPDGQVPTLADIAANETLAGPATMLDPQVASASAKINSIVKNSTFMAEMGHNMYKAHKTWLDEGFGGLGGDDWSEYAWLHNYLGYSLNTTMTVLGGAVSGDPWDALIENATTWRTIDGGLSRLPSSFHPLVDSVTHMNRKVERLSYNESTKRVTLQWKNHPLDRVLQNASYDFAVVAVPFALMRTWRLPAFSDLLSTAIQSYPYNQVCKVALQFETRFWEHLKEPIYGSCSTTTDIPGIGSICYPSYDINSTGPGVMLASYTSTDAGLTWASTPEEQHVQYVVDAMAEIHGDVVYQQYTGKYNRRCWVLDEYETISWASADIGMRKAFMPAFFETEKHIILAGEVTSYTSAWIASALESGVRAAVQMLLELGLVDEAKATTEKWMGRWISV